LKPQVFVARDLEHRAKAAAGVTAASAGDVACDQFEPPPVPSTPSVSIALVLRSGLSMMLTLMHTS
jgi:hypothetical protein